MNLFRSKSHDVFRKVLYVGSSVIPAVRELFRFESVDIISLLANGWNSEVSVCAEERRHLETRNFKKRLSFVYVHQFFFSPQEHFPTGDWTDSCLNQIAYILNTNENLPLNSRSLNCQNKPCNLSRSQNLISFLQGTTGSLKRNKCLH